MFYDINGEKYRKVLDMKDGIWVISYDNPSSPVYITNINLKSIEKIEIPKEYIDNTNIENYQKTDAEKFRLKIIESLLSDDRNIFDRDYRNNAAQKIAEKFNTTKKTVLRLYFKYLAKKCVFDRKPISINNLEKYKNFEWAIKKYYFSAKKITLRMVYDMLLLEKYRDSNGLIVCGAPTWSSFKHYFYRNNLDKSPQKEISRNGLTNYQRNNRPLFGNASYWKDSLGYYQMDASEADVYLVSRFDKRVVVGRPYIYMAVDTLTQLIAGIYIGFDCDDISVITCLANAARDKVEYCKEYGIEITKEQWPSSGLPSTIITDQGKEFNSVRIEQLCQRYEIEMERLPPFRPDAKSLVEKTFDIIQSRYKPFLRGKGVIEPDVQERWSMDYRNQATLNIDEYTKLIIHCVLYINRRVLENYVPSKDMLFEDVKMTPCELWNFFEREGKSRVTLIHEKDMYIHTLKTKQATLNRKGIFLNGFWYKSEEILKLLMEIKNKKVNVFYDMNDISKVYILHKKEFIEFKIPDYYEQYSSLSMAEYGYVKDKIKKQKKSVEDEQRQLRVDLIKEIKDIIGEKKPMVEEKLNSQIVKENKEREDDYFL